jgi:hypothetical protein
MNAVVYEFISGSVSRPEKNWLGYHTLEQATLHAAYMNSARDTYESGKGWNYESWPTKPAPWIAKQNPEYVAVAVEARV